jgi:hypothetical protein
MIKQNCWEYKRCGRQTGGERVAQLGVCPAAVTTQVDGLNSGCNGGRACWAISGTLCGGSVQGTFAMKMSNCVQCEFFQLVLKEERLAYCRTADILTRLNS